MYLLQKINSFNSKIFGDSYSFIIIVCIMIALLKIYEYCHLSKFIGREEYKDKNVEGFLNNHHKQKKSEANRRKQTRNKQIKIQLEEFKNNLDKINFASSNHSKTLFSNKNNYLETMNIINVNARGFNKKKELEDFYINDSIGDLTESQKDAFKWLIEQLLQKFDQDGKMYKLIYSFIFYYLFNNKIFIAKIKNNLEYNLPHTHKNTIIFPESYFSSLEIKMNKNLKLSAINNEGITFFHELLHIHQRDTPEKYSSLYQKWNFSKAKYIHNGNELLKYSRNNPDGNDFKWIWNYEDSSYLIYAHLIKNLNDVENKDKFNLMKVNYKIIKLTSIGEDNYQFSESHFLNKKNTDLHNSDIFNNYFGITNNHYHPNEIASQYFEYVTYELANKSSPVIDNPAYKIFKKYIYKLLDFNQKYL